jgi:nucleoside-diphosphate-sugar epimerase
MRVFVAGASGAIGEPLIAELLERGHSVVGMTTSEAGAKYLEGRGAEAGPLHMLSLWPLRRKAYGSIGKKWLLVVAS